MKNMARVAGASQSWLKPIQNYLLLFCIILSLLVHLSVVIMLFSLRQPAGVQMEAGFTVTLSTIKQPALKRASISHKPLNPICSAKVLADVEFHRTPPQLHQDSEQSAIRSTPLPLQPLSDYSPPMASVENAESFGGTGSNPTEGGSGDSTGTGIRIPLVSSGAIINPKDTLFNHAGSLQSPMNKEKPTRVINRVDSIDSDPIQSPTLERNRSNIVDVVFVISCREAMRPYINDVVAFVKREIRRYQASSKDYRVGIITSDIEFVDGPQYIRYFPLNDHLNKAVQVLSSIPFHPFRTDIQLNAIQYALERCAFRPDAQRRLIVFGNDIPICGGYSPLSVIERCRALGVVLDIHGADTEVGPLLVSQTGGKWLHAFENRYEMEALNVPSDGTAYWKLNLTLNDVIEQRIHVSK
ncbi:VWA domain-containing protein [Candidatus Poribacteria bacterium]|nr:VWA domain-containing protein [Candidatus Poribacteria bacterium]